MTNICRVIEWNKGVEHWQLKKNKWSEVKAVSHVRLCDPIDYTVHGFLQARILAFPFPGDFPNPVIEPRRLRIVDGFFTSWATRDAQRKENPPQIIKTKESGITRFKTSEKQNNFPMGFISWSEILVPMPECWWLICTLAKCWFMANWGSVCNCKIYNNGLVQEISQRKVESIDVHWLFLLHHWL